MQVRKFHSVIQDINTSTLFRLTWLQKWKQEVSTSDSSRTLHANQLIYGNNSLFDRATEDRHTYDGGEICSIHTSLILAIGTKSVHL